MAESCKQSQSIQSWILASYGTKEKTVAKFSEGTKVHVEYDGVVVKPSSLGPFSAQTYTTIRRVGIGHGWCDYFFDDDVDEIVTVTAPPEPARWPPRRNDMWKATAGAARLTTYFAVRRAIRDAGEYVARVRLESTTRFRNDATTSFTPNDFLKDYPDAVLVFRPDVDDDEEY